MEIKQILNSAIIVIKNNDKNLIEKGISKF